MNFQYIEALDVEYLNSSLEFRETVLVLKEINAKKSSNSEEKGQEVEKSYEGLILKELPKHLKYAFLELIFWDLLDFKGVISFLGHAGFYRRFIKDF